MPEYHVFHIFIDFNSPKSEYSIKEMLGGHLKQTSNNQPAFSVSIDRCFGVVVHSSPPVNGDNSTGGLHFWSGTSLGPAAFLNNAISMFK